MIHENAKKYLSGFEKSTNILGSTTSVNMNFTMPKLKKSESCLTNYICNYGFHTTERGHAVKLIFSTVNEITLFGWMFPIGGIEIMEQESVPGWCVFGMDGNGGEIHCGHIECVLIEECKGENE